MVLNRKATGTPLSNSIWGNVVEREDEQGNLVPVDLTLETIDFVPEERAALQALGGKFTVTSEMKDKETDMAGDESLVSLLKDKAPGELYASLAEAGHAHKLAEMHLKEAKCAECTGAALHEMLPLEGRRNICETHLREEATPEETYGMLPEGHRKHAAETYAKEMGMALKPLGEESRAAAEMKTLEGKYEHRISEMERVIKGYQRDEFNRALGETVAEYVSAEVHTEAGKAKLASYRKNFLRAVVSEMNGSTDISEIKAAAAKAWPDFKPMWEGGLHEMSGPNAFVGPNTSATSKPFGYDQNSGRYDDAAVDEAMRYAGMSRRTVNTPGGAK